MSSTKIFLNSSSSIRMLNDDDDTHWLQYIPANIYFNGKEEIKKYFSNCIESQGEYLKSSLRGFPLDGCVINMPGEGDEASSIVVMQSGRANGLSERDEKIHHVVNKTKKVTVWNYDKIPSSSDQFQQSLQWLKVAEALHGN